jgi:hypothetical protein
VSVSKITKYHPGVRNGRRSWLVTFLAFFLVFGAWGVAAPFDGPADEVQHSIRAAGVGSFDLGQIFAEPRTVPDAFGRPGMGAVQRVPVGLDAHAVCWGFDPTKSAACEKGLSGGPMAQVSTSAGRYNPLFYLVVGPPLRWLPNWGGLVVARLLNGALCAAMCAAAFLALRRWSRFGLPATAMLCVATPMLAHLAGGVNPNALEIAAGIAFFAAGIPLFLEPPDPLKKPLITLFGISSVLLLTLRSGGPAWFVFGLVALAVPLRWAWLKEWWRVTRVKLWSAGIVVAGLLSATWIVVMRTGELVPPPPGLWDYTTGEAITQYIDSWYQLLIGMIGVAGWFDTKLWSPFYLIWVMLVGGVVILGGLVGGWVTRWRYLVFLTGGVLLPGVLQVSQANVTGFITGGRYMLPLLAGMPLLAAWILERKLFDATQARSLGRTFVLFLLPVHFALLVFAMVRWQRGLAPDAGLGWFNPLAGDWHPPTGSVLPLLLMVAGLGLTAAVVWRTPSSGQDVPDPDAPPAPATPAALAPVLPDADPEPAAR